MAFCPGQPGANVIHMSDGKRTSGMRDPAPCAAPLLAPRNGHGDPAGDMAETTLHFFYFNTDSKLFNKYNHYLRFFVDLLSTGNAFTLSFLKFSGT